MLSSSTYNIQEFGLARALAQHGIAADVFLAGPSRDTLTSTLRKCGDAEAREVRLPAWSLADKIGIFEGLEDQLAAGDYSLVQVHDDTQFESIRAAEWAASHNTPAILCQGMYEDYRGIARRALQVAYDKVFLPRLRSACRGVIAKSEAAASYCRRKGFGQIEVVPIGLDVSAFHDAPLVDWREKLQIPSESRVVLYVGVLEKRRRPDVLLDAVSRLVEGGVDAFLVVVGSGPLAGQVRTDAQKLLGDKVRVIERLPQSQLASLYSTADIAAVVSEYEIYGMTALESMHFGTPVLASAVGGLADVVGTESGGALVAGYDPREWAEAMSIMLSRNGELRESGRRAAFARASHLTWESVVPRWVNSYHRFV